ncbi:hypothetical protein [Aureliella helgolandensis]|uniref:Lipoprotein n=1 Tax=Aureliella helgolandensis TaxID=2527968 RepID=A0A518G5J7_9BACT|nr:hypothetical protein [Aureliella helgolandensis]QDV23844.1 hypothetical protein Q31a_21510 [Aureliella helgolandensis]
MQYLTRLLITGVAVLVGCTGKQPNPTNVPSKPQHLIMSEGNATSDGLSVSSGNVVVIENQPGIAFATVTIPKQPKRVAYFLVFNHDGPNVGVKTESESSGASGNTFHTINTYGKECTANYEVVLQEETEAVKTETVSIDDKAYDSSKGRVFLIDMKLDPPNVTQVNLHMPNNVPDLKVETDATRQFGDDTVNALRKASKTVNEFCRSIEAKGG